MSERVRTAEKVLYDAFNKGELNAFSCQACAVHNLLKQDKAFINKAKRLDLESRWAMHMTCYRDNRIEIISEALHPPFHTQFNLLQLAKIERKFLEAWQEEGKLHSDFANDKAIQFKGLMKVLDYLYELDGLKTPTETYNKFLSVLDEKEKDLVK